MATTQDAITRIREQTSDEEPDSDGAYRWSNTRLFRFIWDGILSIAGDHPEALYIDSIVVTDLTAITAITGVDQVLPIRNEYLTALVDWVTSRVLFQDAEDAGNLVVADTHQERSDEAKS